MEEPGGSDGCQLTLMVGSTVYGIGSLLDKIYAVLDGYGYRVWMSHKGTIPTDPVKSNEQNCVAAVEQCDAFLGIITGRFGSGIFDKEVRRAVDVPKPRWFLVHHDVVVARQLLSQFRFDARGRRRRLKFQKTAVLDDWRVLDTYDYAIQHGKPLGKRRGNWAQEYYTDDEAMLFVDTQFGDPGRVHALLATGEVTP